MTRNRGIPPKKSSEGRLAKVTEVTAITVMETAPETKTLEAAMKADKITEVLSMFDE